MSMLGKAGNRTESMNVLRARTAVYLTLSGLSLLLNSTFLIVIWKSWKNVKRHRITYHVTNLALSDSIVGASTLGYYIIHAIAGRETHLSAVFVIITWTAVLTSLLAVCLMAIERAICIRKPLNWKHIISTKRIFVVMIGNWVLTLSLAILMNFYVLEMQFVLLVLFYIPIVVTSAVYVNVYRDIWNMTAIDEDTRGQKRLSGTKEERVNRMTQRKVGSFVLVLTMVLFITVSPSFLNLAVKMGCDLFELNCSFRDTVNMLAHYFYMLEIMNFVVNPIFYFWRMSMYRKAFWKMFGRNSNGYFL